METDKKVKIEHVHYIFMSIITLIFVVSLIIARNPDTDAFFLINNGKYIFTNKKLPDINPWVIHDGFNIIIQQWICSLINYIAYSIGGFIGTSVLAFILAIICNISIYNFIKNFTDSKKILIIAMCISNLLLCQFYTTRPYPITIAIIVYELTLLYKFFTNDIDNKQKIKIRIKLCLISLLMINYQSASIVIVFIMILPFMTPWIFKKGWYKEIITEHTKTIYRTIPFMLCTTLINPNGIKSITYLFDSYGSATSNNMIQELMPPNVTIISGITLIIAIALFMFSIAKHKLDKNTIYLTLGTIILAYMHSRNSWLLIPSIIIMVINMAKEYIKSDELKKTYKTTAGIIICSYLLVLIPVISVAAGQLSAGLKNINNNTPKEMVEYLDSLDKDNIILYTEFNNGAYFELAGYKVYIDARPELFMKKINNKEDIYTEYIDVVNGKTDVREFISKYNFTHLVTNNLSITGIYLKYSDDYRLIVENELYSLYEKINN